VWVNKARREQFNVELDGGMPWRSHKPCVAILQQGKKICIGGIDADGHASNSDGEVEAIDGADQPWQRGSCGPWPIL
jgi:hypothetical protein